MEALRIRKYNRKKWAKNQNSHIWKETKKTKKPKKSNQSNVMPHFPLLPLHIGQW